MARRLTNADPRQEQQIQAAILDRLDRALVPKIAGEIARASRAMLDGLRETGAVPYVPDHAVRVADILDAAARRSVQMMGRRIPQQRGLIVPETKDFTDTLIGAADRYLRLEAYRRRITSISETTRGRIIAAVAAGFADGFGIDAIASGIVSQVPAIARARGALIARTETHSAANYGTHTAAQATGLELQKEWVAASDERTRIDHANADGTRVAMDGSFLIGGESLLYPGDPSGSAENIINCRCAISHIVID